MLEVVSLFRERETVDELGIGVIRDAWADTLAPGTTTIQTRPRYFLFVPWMYLEFERKATRSCEIASKARQYEAKLIDALMAGTADEGVIGRLSRAKLKRMPSSIYWFGLQRWQIRRFPGSQDQYHRLFDRIGTPRRGQRLDDDGQPVEGQQGGNWHSGLPNPPLGFPGQATLDLRPVDATYLRERIVTSAPGSWLAFLVMRGRPTAPSALPWEHPQLSELPDVLATQVEHARCFSEAMHGAALLYNFLLAELLGNGELAATYREWLENWSSVIDDREAALRRWDRRHFWDLTHDMGGRVGPSTRLFVDSWLELALSPRRRGVADNVAARRLVSDRERSIKGPRARVDNARAREMWRGDSGTGQLDYRWGITQRVVSDIHAGLAAAERTDRA